MFHVEFCDLSDFAQGQCGQLFAELLGQFRGKIRPRRKQKRSHSNFTFL